MSHNNSFTSPQNERRNNVASVESDPDFLILHYILFEQPFGTKFARYCRGKEHHLGRKSTDPLRIKVNHRRDYLTGVGALEQKRLYRIAKAEASEDALILAQRPEEEEETSTPAQRASPPRPTPPPQREASPRPYQQHFVSPERTTMAQPVRVDNSSFQLDFDRPENNPYGVNVFRDKNYAHDGGPHCDMVKIRMYLLDPRDYLGEEGRLVKNNGCLAVQRRTQPTFLVSNPADLHGIGEEQFLAQQQAAAGRLVETNQIKTTELKYHFPPGVTCRVTPFSVTNNVHIQYDENKLMDYGERDRDGNAVPYGNFWVEYWLAINTPEETNKTRAAGFDDMRNRFGNWTL